MKAGKRADAHESNQYIYKTHPSFPIKYLPIIVQFGFGLQFYQLEFISLRASLTQNPTLDLLMIFNY